MMKFFNFFKQWWSFHPIQAMMKFSPFSRNDEVFTPFRQWWSLHQFSSSDEVLFTFSTFASGHSTNFRRSHSHFKRSFRRFHSHIDLIFQTDLLFSKEKVLYFGLCAAVKFFPETLLSKQLNTALITRWVFFIGTLQPDFNDQLPVPSKR